MPPALLFFFKIALAIWVLLWFHTNFWMVYSSSVRNVVGILIRTVLCVDFFGYYRPFNNFVLPIHEHGVSFHFFVSASISFITVLYFSEYKSFSSFVFIPSYLIVLDVIVNGIDSLISLSVASYWCTEMQQVSVC